MIAMNAINVREESVRAVLSAESSEPENSYIQQDSTPTINRGAPQWLTICFSVCIFIALWAAARRFIALARPSGGSLVSGLDAAFASRTTLTLAHIIPATAFVILAPVVL